MNEITQEDREKIRKEINGYTIVMDKAEYIRKLEETLYKLYEALDEKSVEMYYLKEQIKTLKYRKLLDD